MKKEFKAILTKREDKIEIIVRENYAEILAGEAKAYMKGNFKNFTENDFEKLVETVREDFMCEIEAVDITLENFCKNNKVDELSVVCEKYDTSIFNGFYATEKLKFAKTLEVAIFPDTDHEEKLTKINDTMLIHSAIGYALIKKNKETIVKISSRTDFNAIKEFEWFLKEVRNQEEKINS